MIELFKSYVRWKILAHFLANPNTSFYVKQLARILGTSSGSVSVAVKSFHEDGLLLKEEKGLAHIYSLNKDNSMAAPLKKAYGIALVLSAKPEEKFLQIDGNMISLALFGSYAGGSFDEKSEVDFLVITPKKKETFAEVAMALENDFQKKVSLSVFKLSEWITLAKNEDTFYRTVIGNHILLYGSGLLELEKETAMRQPIDPGVKTDASKVKEYIYLEE